MSEIAMNAAADLKAAIGAAMKAAIEKGELAQAEIPEFTVEVPADRKNGDFATNAAMAGARTFRAAPRKIAEAIVNNIDLSKTYMRSCEIAGPGFINFFLSPKYYSDVLREIAQKGDDYGRSDYGKGEKVMVEFVSANPTGPMHMGNARGGALGDCLAAVLDKAGFEVWREFYVNDAGNQIEKFASSLNARFIQAVKGEDAVEFPEDGYQGEDIKDAAALYIAEKGTDIIDADEDTRKKALVDFALPRNIAKMQADMKKYRIEYDKWFMESELHNSGAVKDVVKLLTSRGLTYEQDGALWYKNKQIVTELLKQQGKTDEEIERLELKDDVLIRANGNPTYFAADIAYHKNKFDRGYTRLINVWGADHHGHVARMKGSMNAIGYDGGKLDVVLMQLVKLVRDGKPVRMSKRTGKAIQLGDLLDEVPVDSARFLFNTREANSTMEFDLDLAVAQDNQNPVYYVQYAHARICSILSALAADGIQPRDCTDEELALLTAPEEKELIDHLAAYTKEVILAAKSYDPTKVTKYVTQLATLFHKFYNACRVKGEDESLMQARLTLCIAVRAVIRNVLEMFKITVPEKM
ncbi:MAG: arginine--tRNA ligase [Clostridia bacterium]|nr:arginine--tRNA ligase [Clostridia bacterium]